jgi:undecaprenyl-diphosphatase
MSEQSRAPGLQWLLRITPALMLYAAVIFAGIYGFAELAEEVYEGEGFRFDRALLTFAAQLQSETLDGFFRVVTRAGSFYILAPVAVIMVSILLWRRKRTSALLLGFGFGGAALISLITKYLLARERPQLFPHLVDTTLTPAFPSGHTTQITAFCIAAFLLVRHLAPRWQVAMSAVSALIILLVAGSRIYLQVHYPSDVLAGLVLGVTWVAGIDLLLRLHGLEAYPFQSRRE